MITTISNPPFNMPWNIPDLARMEQRFSQTELPPKSNANFAFLLTALNESDECIFILPTGVLSTTNKNEIEIKKYLVEMNLIDAIITCPNNMFEKTGIATTIIVMSKNKKDHYIEMVDLREKSTIEEREQRGQFGGKSHENRVYKKSFNILTDEVINETLEAIKDRKTIDMFCKKVTIEEVKENKYKLVPSIYFELDLESFNVIKHRAYDDIINDLNNVIREKNKCKLTINETLAKSIGFDVEAYKEKLNIEIPKQASEIKVLKEDYISFTKSKNQVMFSNNDKESISSIFMMIFQMWKQHIYYLNQEENRYLCELRDTLLHDLASGKIDFKESEE